MDKRNVKSLQNIRSIGSKTCKKYSSHDVHKHVLRGDENGGLGSGVGWTKLPGSSLFTYAAIFQEILKLDRSRTDLQGVWCYSADMENI